MYTLTFGEPRQRVSRILRHFGSDHDHCTWKSYSTRTFRSHPRIEDNIHLRLFDVDNLGAEDNLEANNQFLHAANNLDIVLNFMNILKSRVYVEELLQNTKCIFVSVNICLHNIVK